MTYIIILLSLILVSCSQSKKKYKIGVSQCSADIWREKQNAELRMEVYLRDNVELRFAAAYDSDERQVQQIDSLVATGIDLLIVAPNQVATISPAIDRAYDKHIPVIVFERKTNSQKYTAFMGADNNEMGRIMGEYIVNKLGGQGRVLEIKGLEGSSPAIERHNAFHDVVAKHPGIEVVTTLQGDWTEPTAYECTKRWLAENPQTAVDLVFGMNDRSAMGARKAFVEAGLTLPLFCGIDGLPGKGGGIQLVRDSLLEASYIYPTYGDRLLQLAVDILDGKDFPKESLLMSALVTRDNARVLQLESDEVLRQTLNVEKLHKLASGYLQQLDAQRTINLLALVLFFLMLLMALGFLYYQRQRIRISRERIRLEREQLDFYAQVAHELRTPLTLIEGPLDHLAQSAELQKASEATASIFAIVRRNTSQLAQIINKMLNGVAPSVAEDAQTLAALDVVVPDTKPAGEQSEPEEGYTLLIVDDNPDIRAYLRTILQGSYKLLEAEDGQEGLKLAQSEVPDLIVSDVMMPVMNGLEFCQRVKDSVVTSHIPVILLTARAMSQHQVEGYRSGADAYLTKPFQAEVLMARIQNLLRQRIQLKDIWSLASAAPAGEGEPAVEQKAEEPTEKAPVAAATPNTETPFVQKFRKVVEEHISDSDFGVEDLGFELGLSRVQLYRKMKALTGKSPVELIRTVRLLKARDLLSTTDLNVSEIAYQTGFSAPSYFTKCFKDEFGVLPGDFRS